MHSILSRQEAKAVNLLRYFTGRPCKKDHVAERYVKDCHCVICDSHDPKRRANNTKRKRRAYADPEKRKRIIEQVHNYTANLSPTKKKEIRKKKQEYLNNRRATNLSYRLSCNIRSRLYIAIKKGYKTGSSIKNLGCDIPAFIQYISMKFQLGMSWGNYGEWHLDHIIPLSSFNLANIEEFQKAVHFTNYQPLWKLDNMKKSAKLFRFDPSNFSVL